MALSADLFAKLVDFLPHTTVSSEFGIDSADSQNLALFDTSFVGSSVLPWLEAQLGSAKPVHAVLYSLSGRTRATPEDVWAMQQIQKLAVLVVVADSGDELVNLARQGVTGFRQHIWQRHDVPSLATAVIEQTDQIQALASFLQTRWYESQLVVAVRPPGALAQRVDLRCRALECIDSVDPLGLASWSTLSRSAIVLVSSTIAHSLTELFANVFWNRVTFPVGPASQHHALFDSPDVPGLVNLQTECCM